ncbi:FUSC family protein [Kozakia baliensis]|uniref:FUSC family protein n=1 Tax=Kozakia baliensis TaxID=153496 RepID=UPI00087CA775|nr:FUSC family protein [Kozakia baliensis]AOX19141.1 hypothetical protein A0U90_01235 [Kozakia baliensis]
MMDRGDLWLGTSRSHTRLIAGFSRFLARYAIALTPEQLSLSEGLRAAVATGVALAPALLHHNPLEAWIAFACFWTCLTDPGGTKAERLWVLGSFTLAGGVIIGVSSWFSQFGLIPIFAVLIAAGLGSGLARVFSPIVVQLCSLLGCGAVAATGFPEGLAGSLHIAGYFIAGALNAMLFCLVLWPLHPYAPARRAIAAVYRVLETMTTELALGQLRETVHRQAARNAIERARGLAVQLDAGHGNAVMRARMDAALATAERLFTALLAIEHIFETKGPSSQNRALLAALAPACQEAARQTIRLHPSPMAVTLLAEGLATTARSQSGGISELIVVCADAFSTLGSALSQNDAVTLRQENNLQRSIRPTRAIWQHAGRLAIALCATEAFCLWQEMEFTYWALIATLLVVQPAGVTTFTRSLERMLGSVLGSVLAAGVAIWFHNVPLLLLMCALLAMAAIAVRAVNYTLLVFFLTGLFVLVAEIVMPGDGIASARANGNIVGSIIGLICVIIFWPERSGSDLDRLLHQAIALNLEYAALVLRGESDATARARTDAVQRVAGVATIKAEFAQGGLPLLGGLTGGGATGQRGEHIRNVLRALRRLSGEATLLRFDIETGVREPDFEQSVVLEREAQRLKNEEPDSLQRAERAVAEGKMFDLVAQAGRRSDQPEIGQLPA